MKHNNNLGFTLIELMIVVAIIGILSSIALPAYQTYIAKSILTSLHASAGAGRTAMMSRYQEIGEMPEEGKVLNGVIEANSVTEGLDTSFKDSPYQSLVSYKKHNAKLAEFSITLANINANVNGKVLTFAYEDLEGALFMKCKAAVDIPTKYVPRVCQ